MNPSSKHGDWLQFVVFAAAVAAATGCVHSGPDPFVYAPVETAGTPTGPGPCFSDPLEDCVSVTQSADSSSFPTRWSYPFQPDLYARICRGDEKARLRFLIAVRRTDDGSGSDRLRRVYLGLIEGCMSPGFCSWSLGIAVDPTETPATRDFFLEAARRGCESVLGEEQLERAAARLGRSLADVPKWRTNTQDSRCANVPRVEQPWDDLATRHAAGCLDLVDWLEDHHDDPMGTAAALERCVEQREIRYREADCLRELAGLDRALAVALLRDDERRGWGMSSTINRYATIVLRFPDDGQLEAALTECDLLPMTTPQTASGMGAAILTSEILERGGRLLRFNPSCPARYCEHASLAYELVDLVSPTLDDVVIEERWPALEEVPMGSGDRVVSTTTRGIPVTYSVNADDSGGVDREEIDRLRHAAEAALSEPHELVLFAQGRAYRIELDNLGGWYDLQALIGGLNTVLAARKSDLRYVTLAPHCVPCAQILAGPSEGLIDAAFAGLIEVVDPFNELWTQPGFDSTTLTEPP